MTILTEGKTKIVTPVVGVRLGLKDDVTAGDGRRHDVIPGKGQLSARTICNNFELLRSCGIPVAYWGQDSPNSFIAPSCTMLKREVVVRKEAHGSILKRNPHFVKGQPFVPLRLEYYLKTSGRKWREHDLPCDDPLMQQAGDGTWYLYYPDRVYKDGDYFMALRPDEAYAFEDEAALFKTAEPIVLEAFKVLACGLILLRRKLVDIKFEVGIDEERRVMIGDDVDNGAWRVLDEFGNYVDKQGYRDGDELDAVLAKYKSIADLTNRFRDPAFQDQVRALYKMGNMF